MRILDFTFASPAENLACDEALLDWCETHDGPEVLRFWESPVPFVVVGYGGRVAQEVCVGACAAHGVPILRRCSGGGTVVQGPGCLSYALVLRIEPDGPTRSITTTNRFVLERNAAALSAARGQIVSVRGQTDLALGDLKVSGNSQRRRRRFLLFHGTFLLHADLSRIAELLPMPPREPDYRRRRAHGDFITNLGLSQSAVKSALATAWGARGQFETDLSAAVERLVAEKYSRPEWNWKF
ncbi:MAG: lipoate--protein ligase family protein [Verrucomicrobiales bacterium]|nr:lipoate--protein ligase family protein [Verrucomicrobiales bacterium]